MQLITEIELTDSSDAGEMVESNIVYAGDSVDCKIAGSQLEGQFRCQHGYVVFTTEDTPYEESLHITLLSPEFVVLDSIELSHGYSAGLYKYLKHTKESLEFSFFGGDIWRLTVLDHAQRWSFGQMVPGMENSWRRLLFKHLLSLHRVDK